jgi:hypothetical protein
LVALRVIVPADDDAPIGAVQDRLRAIIEQAGTERLPNSGNGEGLTARVHWIAADVRQGSGERPAIGQKRKRVAGQGELTGS